MTSHVDFTRRPRHPSRWRLWFCVPRVNRIRPEFLCSGFHPKQSYKPLGRRQKGTRKTIAGFFETCRHVETYYNFISIMATWCAMIVGTFHASRWPWQIQLTCWGTRGTRHFSKCGMDRGCALTSWGPYCNPDNDITQAIRRVQGTWQIEQPNWTFQFLVVTWNPETFQELRDLHVLKSFLGHCLNDEDKKKKKKKKFKKRFSCTPCVVYVRVFLTRVCYRHLTGLHFPGMRYVVVLWPDPKTPATDRQWTFGDWDPWLGMRFQSACHGTSEFTYQSLAPIWESVVTVGFSSSWIIARCHCDLCILYIYIYI